jgi:hypothetical protein
MSIDVFEFQLQSMIIQAIKNVHFTKLVKANGRLREFNFRKSTAGSEGSFHVDVSDDRGNRLIFFMKKEDGSRWSIVSEGLPQWIIEVEPRLNEMIEEELA